ncbi:mitochondrial carrier domain-containing protein, partial [Dimargaris cristalligena]
IVYGSLSGVAAKLVEYPFDTVKVRLQAQPADRPWFKGPWDCVTTTVQREGMRGLYRGVASPVLGAMLENSVLFYTYGWFKGQLTPSPTPTSASPLSSSVVGEGGDIQLEDQDTPMRRVILAGALAGVCAAGVLTPIELVKCRVQVQTIGSGGVVGSAHSMMTSSGPRVTTTTTIPKGSAAMAWDIFAQSGIRGFFRGFTPTLIREAGGGAAWFGAYEIITRYFLRRKAEHYLQHNLRDLTLPELIVAGAGAGVAYNIVLYPVDVIKSQIQTAAEFTTDRRPVPAALGGGAAGLSPSRVSMWQIGRTLYQGGGVRALYRGCGITLLRAAPSNAVLFVTY